MGRRILITGAASGIGLVTARLFAAEGASLALIDREAAGLGSIAVECGAFSIAIDLGEEAALVDAVRQSAAAMGGIDGLVNAAGIIGAADICDITLADWQRVLTVNLTAPLLVVREALRHLLLNRSATVVNIASAQALVPSACSMASYSASKGGLISLSKSMAYELAPSVRVNVVCPGAVNTPLLSEKARVAASDANSPYSLKRVGDADEIAAAILFLTSAESSFVTGSVLAVDGGRVFH